MLTASRNLPAYLLLALALFAAGFVGRSTAAQGGGGGGGGSEPPAQFTRAVPLASGGTADSNDHMIAVTGVDMTGSAVLYVIDSRNYQLAVYQATGGSESTQGIRLVGARRIDLDLKLFGLNDRSKYTYEELRAEFEKKGLIEASAPTSGG
jgi:hypothetical protein